MKTPFFLAILIATTTFATPPATAPSGSDTTLDWLMKQSPAATQPATSQPVSPFKKESDGSRTGVIVMNDGQIIHGQIATTPEKPVRVWVETEKDYEDIPFALIQSIQAKVIWERDEKEWHFKASGSDLKEYSGKTYPARETEYTFTLTNGQTIAGPVVCPLYVTTDQGAKTYVLYKRDKGLTGQSLKDLKYVKSVNFSR